MQIKLILFCNLQNFMIVISGNPIKNERRVGIYAKIFSYVQKKLYLCADF